MKFRTAICCMVILLVFGAGASADLLEVNGYFHEVSGQRILHVWGSHYEMGYAHGYLLADEIMEVMNGYVLHLLPKAIYRLAHLAVPPLFEVPEPYLEEVTGIIDGMERSGADIYIEALGRKIDIQDLVLCNAVGDLGAMACSTQIAWGAGTETDPVLQGETAFVRNLDWTLAGPNPFLLPERTIVMVFSSTQEGARTVASISFPGYFGCLTCMNEEGVVASLNIAHNGVGLLGVNYAERFVHVGLIMRQALETDYNQDGRSSIHDVMDNTLDKTRSGAFVITLAEPMGPAGLNPAVIVEADNQGVAFRVPADEPVFTDNVLAATNHLRKLRPAEECDRYDTLRDRIVQQQGRMTLDTMWDIEAAVIQDYFLSTTMQTVYFVPHRKEMGVAYSTAEAYSPELEPSVLSWDDVTELPAGIDLPDNSPDADDDMDLQGGDDDDDDAGCCG